MLTRILLAALLAGVLSGIFVTAVQAYRVTPLILEAESYENQRPETASDGHDHSHDNAKEGESINAHEHPAPEGEEEIWAPEDGLERTAFTMISNILVGVSFSLILIAGVLLTKSTLTFQSGLVWGAGGFVAFVLAPNIGLTPELPGMIGADLLDRQIWWVGTALATVGALMIFAFRQELMWMFGALVLLIAPHIYGAPIAAEHQTNVPANLAADFAVATITTSLVFWLFLGGLLGWLIGRIGIEESERTV